MTKVKENRRKIRIQGHLYASPRFSKKSDADEWYHQMRRKKQLIRDGMPLRSKKDKGPRFIDFARNWMKLRMKSNPASTWQADDQRLRDYILPFFSELPIGSIKTTQVRSLLIRISEEGYVKEGFSIAASTRTRVKALLSTMFSDALNQDEPLVEFNPVLGIKLKDKRKGKKKPKALNNTEECISFLKKAKERGPLEYAIASVFLMTGVRKQELIALKWKNIDFVKNSFRLEEKLEQATGQIRHGTKAGEDETREIYVSKELTTILLDFKGRVEFSGNEDFVFHRLDGSYLRPRNVWEIISSIGKEIGLSTFPHKLRHTYGREFVEKTGNVKALQANLGHSSSMTTDIYSDLAGDRVKGFGEAVRFEIGVQSGDE